MNPDETATVLAKCAAYDRRTVGRADVMAWHEALSDIDANDALNAVTAHYRQTRDWAMPADIRTHARTLRTERRRIEQRAAPLALPSRFEPDDIRDDRVRRGINAVLAALPPVEESARIHHAALKRARAEHGKPLRADKPKSKKPGKTKPTGPASAEIATIAARYLADGQPPAYVADRFGLAKKWCERASAEMRARPPRREWCGQCAYETRQRWNGERLTDCPCCQPNQEGPHQ